MKTIVNVDKNWGIGIGDKLLNHIPADMKFFKENSYDVVRLFINQIGIAIFSLSPE